MSTMSDMVICPRFDALEHQKSTKVAGNTAKAMVLLCFEEQIRDSVGVGCGIQSLKCPLLQLHVLF